MAGILVIGWYKQWKQKQIEAWTKELRALGGIRFQKTT